MENKFIKLFSMFKFPNKNWELFLRTILKSYFWKHFQTHSKDLFGNYFFESFFILYNKKHKKTQPTIIICFLFLRSEYKVFSENIF